MTESYRLCQDKDEQRRMKREEGRGRPVLDIGPDLFEYPWGIERRECRLTVPRDIPGYDSHGHSNERPWTGSCDPSSLRFLEAPYRIARPGGPV